jgi:hypothetical protein
MDEDACQRRAGQRSEHPVGAPRSASGESTPSHDLSAPEASRSTEPELRLPDQPDATRQLEAVVRRRTSRGRESERTSNPSLADDLPSVIPPDEVPDSCWRAVGQVTSERSVVNVPTKASARP